MKKYSFIILMLLILSCNNMKIVFKASKEKKTGTEKIEIYEDNKFRIFLNDTIINNGNAIITDEKIILSSEPKNYNQTLIQSKEFIIKGENLCPLIFDENIDTVKVQLRIPKKIIDETDCYIIQIKQLK